MRSNKIPEAKNAILWHLYTHGKEAPIKDILEIPYFDTPYISAAFHELIRENKIALLHIANPRLRMVDNV